MKFATLLVILLFTIKDCVFSKHSSPRHSIASKRNTHDVPSKKNWIYNQPPSPAQTVTGTPFAAPYSAAYFQPVLARQNPQPKPVTSSQTSYVQGNQRSFTNDPGAVNRGLNQPQNGLQKQAQNARVNNAVLRRQHLRRKAFREARKRHRNKVLKSFRGRGNATRSAQQGSKRSGPVKLNSPLTAAAAADIQGAVVEKGIEVMGKMVDKQLQIIDEAQEKAEKFLKKDIKLDIVPDKGWQSEDMFVPAGYHMDTSISDEEGSPPENDQASFSYPAGLGSVLMNGCFGTGYKEGDPCYVAKWKMDACLNMIDGAAFMGVGFDGRGEYSPESRKMSIVQRSCAGKSTYDDFDVPDTMNVHGIYDTKATMLTFESRSEFQSYLQEQAGVSGSFFGFYGGVKGAWGSSTSAASQQYMALLSVDINRYEIFLDEVKPESLSLSFLREFMDLPISYFGAGAPLKYQDFIQRWGTHYIKSSKFGGQLQIRKFMATADVSSKNEFSTEMEAEFKSLFASAGAKKSSSGGASSRSQTKTSSTTVIALGGSQKIATILSDAYSPTFKNEFKDWLLSIPQYPKPFHFQVGMVTDLLNFRMHDLFPEEAVNWGCEGNAASLTTETNANGEEVSFFQTAGANGTVKHYCAFDSRKGLEEALRRRRISLKRAIEVYLEEGPTSISDFNLPACRPTSAPSTGDLLQSAILKRSLNTPPNWQTIAAGKKLRVIFDLKKDLIGNDDYRIPRNMSRLVKFWEGKWLTSEEDGAFHFYNGFMNGNSGDLKKHKISILGLVLSYNQKTGGLELLPPDFEESKKFFPNLHDTFVWQRLASVVEESAVVSMTAERRETLANPPCHVQWSNSLRFDPTDGGGKCLHFTAATEGSLFVVFSALPKDKNTWYYVEITPERVAIYKGDQLKTSTADPNARGLGDPSLLQAYFVCVTESTSTTLIEYGKTMGTTESGDVYLNMLDTTHRLNVRLYAFANSRERAYIIDAHIVSRSMTEAECKGDTHKDLESRLCTQNCHEDCDPLFGCTTQSSGNPQPSECNVCRVAKDAATGNCLAECEEPNYLTPDNFCVDKSATFDIQVGNSPYGISMRQIPKLASITMCFWLRLPAAIVIDNKSYFPMINYYVSGRRYQEFALNWYPNRDRTEPGMQVAFKTWRRNNKYLPRISFEQFLDKKWHHICVTWNGESGVVMQYLDGVKKQAETGLVWEYEGGGTLKMGDSTSFPYDLSGFNLWDKALAPENIKDMSKSCLRGIGNVKSWLDFKDAAKAKRTLQVVSPSVCTSPSQPSTDEPAEEPLSRYSSPWNNGTHPVGPAGMDAVDEPEYQTLPNPPPWTKGTNSGKELF